MRLNRTQIQGYGGNFELGIGRRRMMLLEVIFIKNINSVKKFWSALDKLLIIELLVVFWQSRYIFLMECFFAPFYCFNVFPEFLLIELKRFFFLEFFCFLPLHPQIKAQSDSEKEQENKNSKAYLDIFFRELLSKNSSEFHKPSIDIRIFIYNIKYFLNLFFHNGWSSSPCTYIHPSSYSYSLFFSLLLFSPHLLSIFSSCFSQFLSF